MFDDDITLALKLIVYHITARIKARFGDDFILYKRSIASSFYSAHEGNVW